MMDCETQEVKGKGLGSWEGQEERQRKHCARVHGGQNVKQESRTRAKVEGHTGDKWQNERDLNGHKADVVERLQKQKGKVHGCSTPDLIHSQLLQAPYFPKMTLHREVIKGVEVSHIQGGRL